MVGKTRTMSASDRSFVITSYAFTIRGYADKGSPTNHPLELGRGVQIMQNWYTQTKEIVTKDRPSVVDFPANLSNPDLLMGYHNVYYYVAAWCVLFSAMEKLSTYDPALQTFCMYLPRVRSRLRNVWNRLNTCPVMPQVIAHAIRNGPPLGPSTRMPLMIRCPSHVFFPTVANGGPAAGGLGASYVWTVFDTLATAQAFVSWLENLVGWLENGNATSAADMRAMKDMMNQATASGKMGVPFVKGVLPDITEVPGLTMDPGVLTDCIARAVLLKNVIQAGADDLAVWPVQGIALLLNRIPILGIGPATSYDGTLWGAPKFGGLANVVDGTYKKAVASTGFLAGTDIPARCSLENTEFREGANYDPEDPWKQRVYEYSARGSYSLAGGNDGSGDWSSVTDIRRVLTLDPIAQHVLAGHLADMVLSGTDVSPFLQDLDVDRWWLVDPNDLVLRTFRIFGASLGLTMEQPAKP